MADNMNDLLIETAAKTKEALHAERITIYVVDSMHNFLSSRVKDGEEVKAIMIPISNSSIAGYIANNSKLVNIKDAYDNNFPALGDILNRIGDRCFYPHAFKSDLKPARPEQAGDRLRHTFLQRINCMLQPALARNSSAVIAQIGYQDFSSFGFCYLCDQVANGTRAQNQYTLTRHTAHPVDSMHRYGHRFYQGALFKAEGFWQGHDFICAGDPQFLRTAGCLEAFYS